MATHEEMRRKALQREAREAREEEKKEEVRAYLNELSQPGNLKWNELEERVNDLLPKMTRGDIVAYISKVEFLYRDIRLAIHLDLSINDDDLRETYFRIRNSLSDKLTVMTTGHGHLPRTY